MDSASSKRFAIRKGGNYAACQTKGNHALSSGGDAPRKYNILNRPALLRWFTHREWKRTHFLYEPPIYARASIRRCSGYLLVGFIYLRALRGEGGRSSPRHAVSRALLSFIQIGKVARVAYFKFGTVTRGKIIAVVYYRALYQLRVRAHLSRRRTSR